MTDGHERVRVRSPRRQREDGVWLEDFAGPAEPDSIDMRKEAGLEIWAFSKMEIVLFE